MKILKLNAENIKRLHAVEITPDGTLITVGGKNGAGKSSVLDSIAYALGGLELVPSEPIRRGQAEAEITVDLGDLIVIRRFKREHLPCDCGVTSPGDVPIVGDDQMHLDKCATKKWGPVKSTLVVKNKEGATYPSPQAVLDKLLGEFTFDPLEFVEAKPALQLEILRKLTNLDTTMLDGQRKSAYDRRAAYKRQHAEAVTRAKDLPRYDVKETAEISMTEVSDQMLKAESARRAAEEAQREVGMAEHVITNEQNKIDSLNAHLKELEDRIIAQRRLIDEANKKLEKYTLNYDAAVCAARETKADIPDTEALRTRIQEIEELNVKIRANHKARIADDGALQLKGLVTAEDAQIEDIDAKKHDLIESVKFPVTGLGFGENGVTFNEVPFEQASKAEQIKVSVAMGLALNPKLKVLLVRDGSALDVAGMTALAEQAAAADAQVWVERVAESKDGVAVMIEDGEVV